MPPQVGVEARGLAVPGHFPYQSGLDKGIQAVVNGRAGRARIVPVDGLQNLLRRGMEGVADEEIQHRVTLRGRPQCGGAESSGNFGRYVRHSLYLD